MIRCELIAMNSVNQACYTNNRGVSLLIAGDTKGAMGAFQAALATVKEVVNLCDDHFESEKDSRATDSVVSLIQESNANLPGLKTGESYLYDRPLLLETPTAGDLDTVLTLYSAVILFNLALSCHQLGHRGKDSALKRAAVLYRMSMQLLYNCPNCGTTPALLSLLALNNRAQIHYEYCDFQQSSHCLKEMTKVMLVPDAKCLYTALPETDVEGLLLNVMLLEPPTAAQAA